MLTLAFIKEEFSRLLAEGYFLSDKAGLGPREGLMQGFRGGRRNFLLFIIFFFFFVWKIISDRGWNMRAWGLPRLTFMIIETKRFISCKKIPRWMFRKGKDKVLGLYRWVWIWTIFYEEFFLTFAGWKIRSKCQVPSFRSKWNYLLDLRRKRFEKFLILNRKMY